jgi:hypothetical protein
MRIPAFACVYPADLNWFVIIEKAWRYQWGNTKPSFEEGQRAQWPKSKKRQKDKFNDLQKIKQKTKYQATRTPLKPEMNSCARKR